MIIHTEILEVDKKIAELRMAANPKASMAAYAMLDKFIRELPFKPSNESIEICLEPNWNGVSDSVGLKDVPYDWITIQPEASVGNGQYTYWKNLKTKIDGISIVITVHARIDIPAEDYALYKSLGKIHTKIIPSRVEESIYCTF